MFAKCVIFFNEGGSQNLKVILFLLFLYIVSIKNDFSSNFSKFNLFPSLLYYLFLKFSIWTNYTTYVPIFGASHMTVVVKNIPADAGDIRRLRFDP